MKKLLLFFSCAWCLLNTGAQVGSLDPFFGTNGIVNMGALKLVPAPDKSFYAVFPDQNDNVIWVTKYLSDGTIDASYGTGGYSEAIRMSNFVDAALTDDGKIVLVGVEDMCCQANFNIEVCQLATSGFRDAAFNGGGDVLYSASQLSWDQALSLNVSDNMIVLLSKSFSSAGGFQTYEILKINDVGQFSGSTRLAFFTVYDDAWNRTHQYFLGTHGSEVLVAANTYNEDIDEYEYSLSRITSATPWDGFPQSRLTVLDNSFFNTPLVVQAQGDKILVASGNYNQITGVHGIAIARYNNDGSLDNSFNGNGMQVADFGVGITLTAKSIAIQGDKILVGSDFTNPTNQNTEFALVRFNNDGTIDNSFDSDGKQTTDLGGRGFLMQQLKVYGNRLFAFGGGVAAAYILEDDNANTITLSCSAGKKVYTDPGVCTALLKEIGPFIAPSPDDTKVNYLLSGATIASGIGSVSGLLFNKGITTVTYSVIGNPGQTCSFNVTVKDREAPVITNISVTPTTLWPPNHKMIDVTVNYDATDNCDAITNLSVKSNEPQTGLGRGDLPNDWQVVDANHLKLRAERNELGTGRIYTIIITARDASGNVGRQYVTVTVPLSQGLHRQSFTSDEGTESLQVKVLSNPSKDYFILQTRSAGSKPLTLRVTNAVGSIMETRTGLVANGQVQVGSSYPNGVYIGEIMQGDKKIIVRLVKLQQ